MKVRALPDNDHAIRAHLERHSSTRTFIAKLGQNSVSDVDKNLTKQIKTTVFYPLDTVTYFGVNGQLKD